MNFEKNKPKHNIHLYRFYYLSEAVNGGVLHIFCFARKIQEVPIRNYTMKLNILDEQVSVRISGSGL